MYHMSAMFTYLQLLRAEKQPRLDSSKIEDLRFMLSRHIRIFFNLILTVLRKMKNYFRTYFINYNYVVRHIYSLMIFLSVDAVVIKKCKMHLIK